MYLPIPCFDSSEFSYHKESKTFSAELSDFNGRVRKFFGQIYDDACDVGLEVVSNKTGKSVKFYLSEEETDTEGELCLYRFLPLDEYVRKNPALAGMSVILFND